MLENKLEVKSEARNAPNNMNDWDSIYPFSAFLGGYRFDAKPYIRSQTNLTDVMSALPGPFPEMKVHNDHFDPETGIRSFSILCMAPTYTWTVVAFDGHVIDWSIQDEDPLDISSHYVVRHVSGYGNDGWTMDLSFKVPVEEYRNALENNWKVRFEFTALEEEGFANSGQERLVGDLGIMSIVQNTLPPWTSTTWLSSVVKIWEL